MPSALIRRSRAWVPLSVQGNSGLYVIGAVEPVPFVNTGPNGIWAVDRKAVNLLTPMYGDQVFSTPGQTIVNRDIFGSVTIKAANVTLSGCKVRGYVLGTLPGGAHSSPPTASTGLVNTNDPNCTNAIIQDCELIPDNPNEAYDAIFARRYRAWRNTIQHCVDGLGVFDLPGSSANNADVKAYGNHVDLHSWFYPAAGHTNGSHCDGMQHQGGNNVDIQGNRFTGLIDPNCPGTNFNPATHAAQWPVTASSPPYRTNSAFQFNTNTGAISTGCIYSKNWLGGGGETVNMNVTVHIDDFSFNIFDENSGFGNSTAFVTLKASSFGRVTGNKFRSGAACNPKFV